MKRIIRNTALRAAATSLLAVFFCVSIFAQGKNPIILIPGLTGSELIDKRTGERVWFKAIKSSSEDLRLPLSIDLEKVRDGIVPGDILRTVKVGPFPVTDVYGGFIRAMQMRGGYVEERWESPSEDGASDSLYVFPYDWRLDNVENAHRLIASVEALRKKLKSPDLKFDIVAHSMGGIIARYAVMYGNADLPSGNRKPQPSWAGSKYFEKIVLMGTPNEGSASSLSALLNGYALGGMRIDLPFLEDSSRFTVFTIPSAYQLLPAPGTLRVLDEKLRPLQVDLYDPKTWSKYDWDPISDNEFPSQFALAERKIAPQFFASQLARAKKLHEALAIAPTKTAGVSFYVVGADCKTALDSVVVYRDHVSGRWKTIFKPKGFTRADGTKVTDDELRKVMLTAGDGVVTVRSLEAITQAEIAGVASILDGGSGKFICEEHYKLAANTRVQDYILGVLDNRSNSARANNEN